MLKRGNTVCKRGNTVCKRGNTVCKRGNTVCNRRNTVCKRGNIVCKFEMDKIKNCCLFLWGTKIARKALHTFGCGCCFLGSIHLCRSGQFRLLIARRLGCTKVTHAGVVPGPTTSTISKGLFLQLQQCSAKQYNIV